jgi:hypothetical protein
MYRSAPAAPLPDFSGFHPAFQDGTEPASQEGDVRRAFYLAYDDSFCQYLPKALEIAAAAARPVAPPP